MCIAYVRKLPHLRLDKFIQWDQLYGPLAVEKLNRIGRAGRVVDGGKMKKEKDTIFVNILLRNLGDGEGGGHKCCGCYGNDDDQRGENKRKRQAFE